MSFPFEFNIEEKGNRFTFFDNDGENLTLKKIQSLGYISSVQPEKVAFDFIEFYRILLNLEGCSGTDMCFVLFFLVY